MGAGQHEGDGARAQVGQPVVAQAVGERHRVVLAGVGRVDRRLQSLPHGRAALVVESLGQELHVHLARRAGGEVAQLAVEDLAGDDAQALWDGKAQRGSSFTATLR